MDLLTLIYLRPLLRLRRQMREHHHLELIRMVQSNLGVSMFAGFMPKWWNEAAMLIDACMKPTQFPVHVLADDLIVAEVKRVRNGLVVHLYAIAGIIVLGDIS